MLSFDSNTARHVPRAAGCFAASMSRCRRLNGDAAADRQRKGQENSQEIRELHMSDLYFGFKAHLCCVANRAI